MKSILFKLLLLCAATPWLHAVTDQEGWESDLKTLKHELPAKHRNLFFVTSQSDFNQSIATLKADLPSLTDDEAYWRLQKIVVPIGDDHTGVYRKNSPNDRYFPFAVGVFSDGIYVLAVPEANKQALGARITAVKDEPVAKVIPLLRPYISIATKATLKQKLPNVVGLPGLWRAAGLAETNGNLKITCITQAQESYTFELQPQTQPEFRQNGEVVKFTPKPCATAYKNKSYFHIAKFDDGKILYAQYNKCSGREFEEKAKGKEAAANIPSIYEFFDQLKNELKSKSVEKFVFDLRWNPGGSDGIGTAFVHDLAKNKTINQRGKLFVLIGRRTFSSAITNAFDFKEFTKATLIGEPTSGTPTHYGAVQSFVLPHTQITVAYSTKYISRGNAFTGSLLPEITAEQTFEDWANGIDPAFQAAVGSKIPESAVPPQATN